MLCTHEDASPAEFEYDDPESGGDPACWAGLLCPECFAMSEGGYHRDGCSRLGGAQDLRRLGQGLTPLT